MEENQIIRNTHPPHKCIKITSTDKVAYISTATDLYIHSLSSTAVVWFYPPQYRRTFLMRLLYTKPVVRAIEVSHAACTELSFDEILDLTADVF